jgi:peptidyl-tRNA hydrolase, PTH1 family
MKLIFAQGNPGNQYTHTRHNVGFLALDRLADQRSAPWKRHDKFKADIAETTIHGEKVLLVKPLSFYNETGQVARALTDFYKLSPATDVLVIHDELALPFGTLRIREKGSDAGNNGIKSLNAHLGDSYWRLRVGVWNELRNRMDDAAFVLSQFSHDELTQLNTIIDDKVVEIIADFASSTLTPTSHSL